MHIFFFFTAGRQCCIFRKTKFAFSIFVAYIKHLVRQPEIQNTSVVTNWCITLCKLFRLKKKKINKKQLGCQTHTFGYTVLSVCTANTSSLLTDREFLHVILCGVLLYLIVCYAAAWHDQCQTLHFTSFLCHTSTHDHALIDKSTDRMIDTQIDRPIDRH